MKNIRNKNYVISDRQLKLEYHVIFILINYKILCNWNSQETDDR